MSATLCSRHFAARLSAAAFDPCAPVQELASEGFERAWIALHGPGGEDGLIQGALEWLASPTRSGVLARR